MNERHRIVEIRTANVETSFGRVVGRNSKSENYGFNQREWLVQVKTDNGLTGVTNARPAMNVGTLEQLQAILGHLLGRDVFEFYKVSGERVVGVNPRWSELLRANGFLDFVLFDLMGRALGVPACKLLGDRVRDRVDAYDSSLYFQDIVHPEEGADAVAREAKEAVQRGWRAVKLKLGRPGRWFESQAGMERDVEVVLRTREAVGPDVRILVDANNGYDGKLPLLETFVRETASAYPFWMEEMITEDVAGYRRLKEWRDRYSPETMLVDGEGDDGRNTIYWTLMEEGLLDAIQPDMLQMGFWPFHQLAQDIAESGYATRIAPHNFNAAVIGLRGVVQFGAVTPSFVIAEDSTLEFDVYLDPGYKFEDGAYSVPASPGLGVEIDQNLYERRV
jgi:L-alanine-DL-glutamate epimerase-like enolase superfamily enzyme